MGGKVLSDPTRKHENDPPVIVWKNAEGIRESVANAARRILKILLDSYRGPVAIRLWNGETVIGSEAAPCVIVFRHPAPLRDLILKRDLVKLAESHLAGLVDVEGDMEAVFNFVEHLSQSSPPLSVRARVFWAALTRLPSCPENGSLNTACAGDGAKLNSRESISHHYDVSNKFYRLWLDPEMVYSCAYFKDESQSLGEAQRDKLDHILRKLRLRPGQRLLDIGCGWGALVIHAAKNYGAMAHGITLSERQYEMALERVREEGLEERVKIELLDYRDLPETEEYDRVVSVGMFEHIGVRNFPVYFRTIKRVLKPGGLFLNHGITNDSGWGPNPLRDFINKYVFPDGELTRISVVIKAMEEAGFEILDVESLRRHYAMTLRRWIGALEENREKALRLVSEPTYRVWRLYMAGSAYYFSSGDTMVYQALACHKGDAGAVPLRRDDLYR